MRTSLPRAPWHRRQSRRELRRCRQRCESGSGCHCLHLAAHAPSLAPPCPPWAQVPPAPCQPPTSPCRAHAGLSWFLAVQGVALCPWESAGGPPHPLNGWGQQATRPQPVSRVSAPRAEPGLPLPPPQRGPEAAAGDPGGRTGCPRRQHRQAEQGAESQVTGERARSGSAPAPGQSQCGTRARPARVAPHVRIWVTGFFRAPQLLAALVPAASPAGGCPLGLPCLLSWAHTAVLSHGAGPGQASGQLPMPGCLGLRGIHASPALGSRPSLLPGRAVPGPSPWPGRCLLPPSCALPGGSCSSNGAPRDQPSMWPLSAEREGAAGRGAAAGGEDVAAH